MALDNGVLLVRGFDFMVASEDNKMAAYAAFTALVLNTSYLAVSKTFDEKELRGHMATMAANYGIQKNTWESYVSGIFKCAAKMAQFVPAEVDAISDMDEDGACAEIERIYFENNVLTGGHVREWAKQEGFEPYDAERVARDRKAKAAADKAAAGQAGLAALMGTKGRDSSTISDLAKAAAPADPLAAILALIGNLTDGQLLDVVKATNARLGELDAAKARPTDKVAPVLRDDATVAKLSSLGRVKHAA